jgi:hypothetical protein
MEVMEQEQKTEEKSLQQIVTEMLATAASQGLQVEVSDSFCQHLASGEPPARAAWCALYDWDC